MQQSLFLFELFIFKVSSIYEHNSSNLDVLHHMM